MSSTPSRRPPQMMYVQRSGTCLDQEHGIDVILSFGLITDHEGSESLKAPVSNAVEKVVKNTSVIF